MNIDIRTENYVGNFDPMIRTLFQIVKAADEIRIAQKNYMANRGDDFFGKKVAEASENYDKIRSEIGEIK